MSSKRELALIEIGDRLAMITIANGYNTDVGENIIMGETPSMGPDDPNAALAVEVGADTPGFQGEQIVVSMPVRIQALVKANVANPWLTVEKVIADIKTAVETDHDLGGILIRRGLERGSVIPFEREPGSEFTGAAVTYNFALTEVWGTP